MRSHGRRRAGSAMPRLACLAAVLFAAGAPACAQFTHVYAFGDSYSDNGAALRLTGQALAAGIPSAALLPAPPAAGLYWEGRWSNGPTAVERLAATLGVGLSDYAVGGALSGKGNYYAWLDAYRDTGVAAQVSGYLESLGGKRADPDALYLIAASANDFFRMVDFKRPEKPIVRAALAGMDTSIAVKRLAAAGARTVLVSLSYPLATVPAVAADAQAAASARAFVPAYDGSVRALAMNIAQQGKVRLVLFDWGDAMRRIAADGARHGIADVSTPCQPTMPAPRPACADPDAHLWWDEYHPSRRTHQLIAEAMARVLEASKP